MKHRLRPLAPLVLTLAFAGAAQADGVTVNAYGDVNYFGSKIDLKLPAGYPEQPPIYSSTFSMSRVTTMLTGSLGRLTLISENTFQVPLFSGSNDFLIDVERFEISYQVHEWLRLKAGRFHSAFGYYNDTYHSGYYYQLQVDRPGFTKFEEDGGLIPARAIGVHADGRFKLGASGALRYDVEVANSRGATVEAIANRQDLLRSKSVNFRLRFEPSFLEGLVVGANYYFGGIPGSAQTTFNPLTHVQATVVVPPMDEKIVGAHLAYVEGNIHFIAEYAHFLHSVRGGGPDYHTNAGFFEAGYSFGEVTPYVLLDAIRMPSVNGAIQDPYFAVAPAGIIGTRLSLGCGVKWQVVDGLALKIEAQRAETDSVQILLLSSQAAVAF